MKFATFIKRRDLETRTRRREEPNLEERFLLNLGRGESGGKDGSERVIGLVA